MYLVGSQHSIQHNISYTIAWFHYNLTNAVLSLKATDKQTQTTIK